MTAPLVTVLIASLVASPVPVTAHGRTIHEVIDREAGRLAVTAQHEDTEQQWADVRKLKPGTKLIVTTGGLQKESAVFVRADESHVVIRPRGISGEKAIARTGVHQINELITTTSTEGPLIGATVGLAVGVLSFLALTLSDTPCGDSDCTGRNTLRWSLVAGLPTAGGVLGYHATRHTTQRIVYRVP